MKHRLITGCFILAIAFQLGLGIFMTYHAIKSPGTCRSFRVHLGSALMRTRLCFTAHPVQLDFPDGHLCIYIEHRVLEIAYTVLSLFFGKRRSPLCAHPQLTYLADVVAFVVIVIRLLWRRPSSVKIPSIVQTIVKDATLYVLLLCTSRIIFVSFSVLASVCTTLLLRNNV